MCSRSLMQSRVKLGEVSPDTMANAHALASPGLYSLLPRSPPSPACPPSPVCEECCFSSCVLRPYPAETSRWAMVTFPQQQATRRSVSPPATRMWCWLLGQPTPSHTCPVHTVQQHDAVAAGCGSSRSASRFAQYNIMQRARMHTLQDAVRAKQRSHATATARHACLSLPPFLILRLLLHPHNPPRPRGPSAPVAMPDSTNRQTPQPRPLLSA